MTQRISFYLAITILTTLLLVSLITPIHLYLLKLQNPNEKLFDLVQQSPSLKTFYEGISIHSMASVMYNPIFIARRWLLAVGIVFMTGRKEGEGNSMGQVFAMMVLSICMLVYLITVKPFKHSKIMQSLELFNEAAILIGLYHLVLFTDLNDDVELRYQYGWSLNLLMIIKLIFNVYIIGREQYRQIRS